MNKKDLEKLVEMADIMCTVLHLRGTHSVGFDGKEYSIDEIAEFIDGIDVEDILSIYEED